MKERKEREYDFLDEIRKEIGFYANHRLNRYSRTDDTDYMQGHRSLTQDEINNFMVNSEHLIEDVANDMNDIILDQLEDYGESILLENPSEMCEIMHEKGIFKLLDDLMSIENSSPAFL